MSSTEHETEKETEHERTWRDNWFIKNILAEIPVIGGFFHTSKPAKALYHAGKSTCMLLGGTTMMMLHVLPIDENDGFGEKFAKMTADMVIGMTAGKVLYNTITSAGKWSFQASRDKLCHPNGYDKLDKSRSNTPTQV